MQIQDIFAKHRTTFSFEFFPPQLTGAVDRLFAIIQRLEQLKPSFVSVTYGAGGSTRQLTHDLVMRIHSGTDLDPVPHLTCVCHTESEIRQILERYTLAGISNIMALGGDLPRDRPAYDRTTDAFRHAADLVRFIQKFNASGAHPHEQGFGIGVAGFPEGHPATPNRLVEMDYLKAKVDAGIDYICTQLFFDNRDFYDFRDRCELAGIRVPIVAGIMPITSKRNLERIAELAAGSRFPAGLLKGVARAGDDPEAIKRVGVQWGTEQCRDLLDHQVRGIHFYTLNQSDATVQIYQHLGVSDSLALENGGL